MAHGVVAPASSDGTSIGEHDRSGGSWQFITLLFAAVLVVYVQILLIPQMVTLAEEFNQPISSVAWTAIIYGIVAAPFAGLAGGLGKLYGNKLMLMFSLCCILAGGLIVALSPSFTWVLVGRAVEGGAGGIVALTLGIAGTWWSGKRLRTTMVWIMSIQGVMSIVTYPLSAWFVYADVPGGWRMLFWSIVVMCVVCILMAWRFVLETHKEKVPKLDYLGSVLLVAWCALLLAPLSKGNEWGWTSPLTLGTLIPGAILAVIWCIYELRIEHPLLDLRVLAKHGVWQGLIVLISITIIGQGEGASVGWIIQTPDLGIPGGHWGLGLSIMWVGFAFAFAGAGTFAGGTIAASVMRKIGLKWTMVLGSALGLSFFGMAVWHSEYWMLCLWMFIYGAMFPFGGTASYAVAVEAVPVIEGSRASAVLNVGQNIGGAVGGALVGYVLSIRILPIPGALPHADMWYWVFAAVASSAVVATVVCLFMNPAKFYKADRTLETDLMKEAAEAHLEQQLA